MSAVGNGLLQGGGVSGRAGKVTSMGHDSLSVAIGTVEFHLRVAPDGRVLGGRIPAQNVVVVQAGILHCTRKLGQCDGRRGDPKNR